MLLYIKHNIHDTCHMPSSSKNKIKIEQRQREQRLEPKACERAAEEARPFRPALARDG
jgi:hypothetical protein